MNRLILLQLIALLFLKASDCFSQGSPTLGSFTDERDGKVYGTVTYYDDFLEVDVTWMTENMDYEIDGSYYYDDNKKYASLGRFYSGEAIEKACPPGWRLGTKTEYESLVDGWEIKGLWQEGFGSNTSKFSFKPAGERTTSGEYKNIRVYGYSWTSQKSKTQNTRLTFRLSKTTVYYGYWDQRNGYSCRCIKD